MKKIVLIIRKGFDAEYILSNVRLEHYEVSVIVEKGNKAKKKKLKRFFNNINAITFFTRVFDLIVLFIYDYVMTKRMDKILGNNSQQQSLLPVIYAVDDVNDEKCIEKVNAIHPDLILIYGTAILRKDTIEKLNTAIYNIHSSILPFYRNVHSDFWAFKANDYEHIGITIFKLTAGIDSGDIAMQVICPLPKGSKLEQYKAGNLKVICELIPRFVDRFFKEGFVLIKQDDSVSCYSNTPSAKDIFDVLRQNKSVSQ